MAVLYNYAEIKDIENFNKICSKYDIRNFCISKLSDDDYIPVIENIFETLAQNNNINTLSIGLGGELIKTSPILLSKIMSLIKYSHHINHLILINIEIEDMSLLTDILSYNHNIRSLQLTSISINTKNAKILANEILYNKSLTRLYIGYNKIDPDDMNYILKAITYNTNIDDLLIYYNLSNIDYNILCNMLIFNKSIVKLELSDNAFTILCALVVIFESLIINSTLKSLIIKCECRFYITDEAISKLVNVLNINTNLVMLSIPNLIIRDFDHLKLAIKYNRYLTYLDIRIGHEYYAQHKNTINNENKNIQQRSLMDIFNTDNQQSYYL